MRKIIVLSMITLDGVMQGVGGPDEDPSGGFKYGGWSAPYEDEVLRKIMPTWMNRSDLLLGRKTFETFASVWPVHADAWPGINDVTKYVVSSTMKNTDWKNTVFLEGIADVKKLKNSAGSELRVWGSSNLIQSLFKHDLVDELWLQIHPLTLGTGKRLFAEGTIPAAFTLAESTVTPSGVIVTNYVRAGEVRTGTIGG